MIPMGHHIGEDVLGPALLSGGSLVSVVAFTVRARFAELRRWIRRR